MQRQAGKEEQEVDVHFRIHTQNKNTVVHRTEDNRNRASHQESIYN